MRTTLATLERVQKRPRILVTRPDGEANPWEAYAEGIAAAGAEPIDGHPGAPPEHYDGLLLTGGVDIDPARYGEAPHRTVTQTDPARDAFEVAALQATLERDAPVLGICRGHQLFNVAHGGALLQHIEQREPHRSRRDADTRELLSGWHDVEVIEGTRLAAILGAGAVRVNSRHHQAVTPERVAPALVVAATAPDGIVEALEAPAHRWALSVQWHPERAELAAPSRALFEAFVRACAEAAVR